MPNWVGDAVMATPTLRAIRKRFPQAHIATLGKPYVRAILEGSPHLDDILDYPDKPGGNLVKLAARLKKHRFDLAVLLPNSFRSGLLVFLAGIKRRVGYDRDGRGVFLTDNLIAPRSKGKFIPTPALTYYLSLAKYLGARQPDTKMELFVEPQDQKAADELFAHHNIEPDDPIIILNAGAAFGSAKCWPTKSFAQLGDLLVKQFGAKVLVSGGPREGRICRDVCRQMTQPAVDMVQSGPPTLGRLKAVIQRASLLVTNDTGARHFGAALEIPVVTLFGPTDPQWTDTFHESERIVRVKVVCGPCKKRKCPKDHRCMTRISPKMVLNDAADLLEKQ